MKKNIRNLIYLLTVIGLSIIVTNSCTEEGLATLSTSEVSEITKTSATSGGNITDDGESHVSERGVVWSTSPKPTTANSMTMDGDGSGSFTSVITELTPGTIYYVRAYASNDVGTAYGKEKSFTTESVLMPTLTTKEASSITTTTASCGGIISDDGGAEITVRGVCWNTSGNPLIEHNTTNDGTETGEFTSFIDGLTINTTYYVRAYATNELGTSYGNEISFSTIGLATLSTTAITSVTSTTAISGGTISDDGGASITDRGVCWSTTSAPTIFDDRTQDGTGLGSFTSNITDLTPGLTYYVRAYATNSAGTAYGDELYFTLNAEIPTLTTTAISSILTTTATSGGDISNDGGATVTERGVCWSTSTGPTISDSKTSDGTGTGSFVSNMTELTANYTTYYVRAYATNSAGTAYGNELSFMTNAIVLPTLTTTAITSITTTSASSGGTISDDGGASVTARGVCWSITVNPTITDNITSDGTGIGQFVSSVTGLTMYTTYYIRAYATNSAGTAYGNQLSFTTQSGVPTLSTTSVSSITQTSASSGGNISSNGGASVTVRGVCWSTSSGPTTSDSKTLDGSGSGSFVSSLTGLTLETMYYVRAYATNSNGTAYGDEQSFTTSDAVEPTLTTTAITSITTTSASSGGNVTSDGGVSVTGRGVCWSTSVNPTIYDSNTSDETGTGSFTSSLTGLSSSTIYYIRAYATNSVGTSYGDELSFTTDDIVVPTLTTTSISSITSTTASSGGDISFNGGDAVFGRGVCWSASVNPTIADSKTSDGTGTGVFASSITELSLGNTYYVRAYATNSAGTAYGNELSFTTVLAIGESYQGGVIAYILQSGDPGYVEGETHGLIAAATDQGASKWGADVSTGANATALGTGNANTNTIIGTSGIGASAAQVCADLDLNGYTDWYLPSKDELGKLYANKEAIGGFPDNTIYWSSSEHFYDRAWRQNFTTGSSEYLYGYKSNAHTVRPIRSF